jgi:3-dehydroquinate synthase
MADQTPEKMLAYSQTLNLPTSRTEIRIGVGAMDLAAENLRPWLAGRTLFLLSTPAVRALHGSALDGVRGMAGRVVELTVEDGEGAKAVAVAEGLWRRMLAAGGKRDSRLLTFGGGSVSDLGGFVAGCFLRGIECVHCPTTLLAQVDAAVGGKTGVDLPGGKNIVGLFHHPAWVFCDTALLATLPKGELRSGLMEVVKMAFLLDPPTLRIVEGSLPRLLAGEPEALAPVVAAATAAKCSVVAGDPREGDRRRLLNFGHTLGHAIEAVLGFAGLRHGEAIAYGMLFALRLACERKMPVDPAQRLRILLKRCGLPPLPPLVATTLMDFAARDKKATESGLVWVLPSHLGQGEMVILADQASLLATLELFLEDPWAPFV